MDIQTDIDEELRRLRVVANRMDALFHVPGTRIKVGLDNILGLVPFVGDLAAALPSLWLIHRANKIGATRGTLAYMMLNTTLDFTVGSIPIVGDIFDVVYSANLRNYAALEAHLNRRAARAKKVETGQLPTEKQVV